MRKIIFVLLLISIKSGILAQTDESWMVYDDSEVATVKVTVDPEFLEWLYQEPYSDSTQPATVHFQNALIDETIDSVGFRVRGKTSRGSAKKSFKLSFNSYKRGGKFYGLEKLNINGEHNDPSIVRSKLCWDMLNDIGMKATRAAHAALYINDVYYGLYISVEHIDETYINRQYDDDTGNLWKCLYPADLRYLGPNAEDYQMGNPNGTHYELKTNKEENDYKQFARFVSLINRTSNEKFADSIGSILDVNEFLKYQAMNVILGSWDDYRSVMNNYYLYYEPDADIFRWIPYDYDNTLGVDFFNIDWTDADPYNYPQVVGGNRPLSERLLDNSYYRNLYTHFIEFHNNNVFERSLWDDRIQELYEMIVPYAEQDTFRTMDWGFSINDFHNSFDQLIHDHTHIKIRHGIREYIDNRFTSLNQQINYVDAPPLVYDIDWHPKLPEPDDSIYVEIAAFSPVGFDQVNIKFYRKGETTLETYVMDFNPVEGTKIVEEADRWVGVIPPLGEGIEGYIRIQAIDLNNNSTIYPRHNAITVNTAGEDSSGIVINELLAINTITNQTDEGLYSDWLELYNNSGNTVSLEGKYLTDKRGNKTKWKFPDGAFIDPNEFLLVWCDENDSLEGFHTNFKLDGDGEFLALIAEDGVTVIDSFTFGVQKSDTSYGRFEDGTSNWMFLPPTPGEPNSLISGLDKEIISSTFKLEQNYPNPFNPSTLISYLLAVNCKVQLKIFDVLGRETAVLVNETQKAGNYQIEFDASEFPSGVYFYSLKTNDGYFQTKKMVLLK